MTRRSLFIFLFGLASITVTAAPAMSEEEGRDMVNLKVIVASTNDEWTDTGMRVFPGDVLVIAADGKIRIGGWSGEVNADGNQSGEGALTGKIGVGAAFELGYQRVLFPKEEGSFKLRVADRTYTDNSGLFEVMVLRIPPSKIPEQQVVEAD